VNLLSGVFFRRFFSHHQRNSFGTDPSYPTRNPALMIFPVCGRNLAIAKECDIILTIVKFNAMERSILEVENASE